MNHEHQRRITFALIAAILSATVFAAPSLARIVQGPSSSGSSGISLTDLSAASPITYNSGTGQFGWTNANAYITTSSISSTLPITYNTGTGMIGWSNSNAYITTSSISSTVTGLTYTSNTGVFSLTSGYAIPLSASTTNWESFYQTPSGRITAGAGLYWSSNTLTATTTYKSVAIPAQYTTSTSQWDDPVFTFKKASTIDNVYVAGRDGTGTVSFQLVYGADPTLATSTAGIYKLFSTTQTVTSTPSTAREYPTFAAFASSTPAAGDTLRIYAANASSSGVVWTVWYHEN